MISYIIRRLITAVFILIIVSLIVFFAMRLLPGDPILMYMSNSQYQEITPEQLEMTRHQLGLDKPVALQYIDWMSGVARGDFGNSIIERQPVLEIIGRSLPVSFYLGLLSFIIFNIIGIPAGIICAVRRGTWVDNLVTSLANIGITAPVFWVGILMIYLFGYYLKWLPIYGYTSPFTDFGLSTREAVMPVICLAMFPIASTARQTRSAMLEVMQQDYIRTAWSKGLRERSVILKHAMKNSLIPVITLTGMGVAYIFGGQVLVETVFNIPGMGRLAVSAVLNHDYLLVQGIILIISTVIVLTNLVVDLSYGWLDPRIRYG